MRFNSLNYTHIVYLSARYFGAYACHLLQHRYVTGSTAADDARFCAAQHTHIMTIIYCNNK